jgi:hypothetical protein
LDLKHKLAKLESTLEGDAATLSAAVREATDSRREVARLRQDLAALTDEVSLNRILCTRVQQSASCTLLPTCQARAYYPLRTALWAPVSHVYAQCKAGDTHLRCWRRFRSLSHTSRVSSSCFSPLVIVVLLRVQIDRTRAAGVSGSESVDALRAEADAAKQRYAQMRAQFDRQANDLLTSEKALATEHAGVCVCAQPRDCGRHHWLTTCFVFITHSHNRSLVFTVIIIIIRIHPRHCLLALHPAACTARALAEEQERKAMAARARADALARKVTSLATELRDADAMLQVLYAA